MSAFKVSIVKRKPPHGELNDEGTKYLIPSKEKAYAPWLVEPVAPTWRDVWAIVRKRYVPRLRVHRPTSAAQLSDVLKAAWLAPLRDDLLNGS